MQLVDLRRLPRLLVLHRDGENLAGGNQVAICFEDTSVAPGLGLPSGEVVGLVHTPWGDEYSQELIPKSH